MERGRFVLGLVSHMAYSGGTIRRDAEDIEIEPEWSCNRREGKGKQPVE